MAASVVKPKKQARVKRIFTSKVYRGSYQSKSNSSTVNGRIQLRPPVPWIQLRGYWLSQMGFPVDVELTVEATKDCITLRPKLPLKK